MAQRNESLDQQEGSSRQKIPVAQKPVLVKGPDRVCIIYSPENERPARRAARNFEIRNQGETLYLGLQPGKNLVDRSVWDQLVAAYASEINRLEHYHALRAIPATDLGQIPRLKDQLSSLSEADQLWAISNCNSREELEEVLKDYAGNLPPMIVEALLTRCRYPYLLKR